MTVNFANGGEQKYSSNIVNMSHFTDATRNISVSNNNGGIPVDRTQSTSLVDQLSLKIKKEDGFQGQWAAFEYLGFDKELFEADIQEHGMEPLFVRDVSDDVFVAETS